MAAGRGKRRQGILEIQLGTELQKIDGTLNLYLVVSLDLSKEEIHAFVHASHK